MKSDLEKRLEYVRSQREILQRTEEELQKQIDTEKAEFDFKNKMPVGSVWLGVYKVEKHDEESGYIFNYKVSVKETDKIRYHAHQIVKAAQEWHNKNTIGCFDPLLVPLQESLKVAEQDGVLQNLE